MNHVMMAQSLWMGKLGWVFIGISVVLGIILGGIKLYQHVQQDHDPMK